MRPTSRHLYSALFAAYVVGFSASALVTLPIRTSDSTKVAAGAYALVDCAAHGSWIGCPGSNQFGVLQYLLAIPLALIGIPEQSIVVMLAFASLLSVLGLLFVVRDCLPTQSLRGQVYIAVVVAGPLCVYGASSFSEALQALIYVWLVSAVVSGRRLSAGLAAGLAACSRESALIFLVPLAIAALLLSPRTTRRARLVWVGSGLAAGTALLLAFNVWKFGSLGNPMYVDSAYIVQDDGLRANLFAGVWLAPGGGVVWFWFIGFATSLGLSALTVLDRAAPRSHRLSAGLALGGLLGLTALLSSWYAPFGWVAWGPRLMIPSVLAACVVAILAGAGSARRLLTGLGPGVRRAGAIAGATLTCATAVPNVSALTNDQLEVVFGFFRPGIVLVDGPCNVLIDAAGYYECLRTGTWQASPSQFSLGWAHVDTPTTIVMAALTLGLVVVPFAKIARRGREPDTISRSATVRGSS